jgi:hypothetical protein
VFTVWPWRLLTGRFEAVERSWGAATSGLQRGGRAAEVAAARWWGDLLRRQPAAPGGDTSVRRSRLVERQRHLWRYTCFFAVRPSRQSCWKPPMPVWIVSIDGAAVDMAPIRLGSSRAQRGPCRPGRGRIAPFEPNLCRLAGFVPGLTGSAGLRPLSAWRGRLHMTTTNLFPS